MKHIAPFFTLAFIITLFIHTPGWAQKEHGKASFYSKKSTGARTASGLRLHHDSLSCAHRSYPFGTLLKVTNMNNNKSVIVKVIDRGPFGRGRIIDLSWAAAKEIGMLSQGVATVKVEKYENRIPYKPDDIKLPEIDFEITDNSKYDYTPKWSKGYAPHKQNGTKENAIGSNKKSAFYPHDNQKTEGTKHETNKHETYKNEENKHELSKHESTKHEPSKK